MRSLISLLICCVVSSKLRDHRAPHAFISLINRKLSPSNISGHNFLSLYVYSFLFFLLRRGNERNISCPSCSTKKKANLLLCHVYDILSWGFEHGNKVSVHLQCTHGILRTIVITFPLFGTAERPQDY